MILHCYHCREPIRGSLGYCPLCDAFLTPLDSLTPWRALRARWARQAGRRRHLVVRSTGYTLITLAFLVVVVTASIVTKPGETIQGRAAPAVTVRVLLLDAGSPPERPGHPLDLVQLPLEAGPPPPRSGLPPAAGTGP